MKRVVAIDPVLGLQMMIAQYFVEAEGLLSVGHRERDGFASAFRQLFERGAGLLDEVVGKRGSRRQVDNACADAIALSVANMLHGSQSCQRQA